MNEDKQTILVTGGAGYIGSITTKTLLDQNYNVIVVDNLCAGHRNAVDKRAIFELADVGDKTQIAAILKKYSIDAVIDFAAYLAVGESMTEPEKYFDNNVKNFVNLLDVLTESGVKKIIKSSTAAVYGTPKNSADLPLTEDYVDNFQPNESALLNGTYNNEPLTGDLFFDKIINLYRNTFGERNDLQLNNDEITKLRIPTSIYGLTKLLDEIIMKKYDNGSGLKFVALRYFNVAGADISGDLGQDNENPTHLFASAIYNLLGKKDKLLVFGNDYPTKDGTGIRDYIHVNDLAQGHIAALKYLFTNDKSDVFNLGTGIGYSVIDIINAIEKTTQKKIIYEFAPRRSGDVAKLYANPQKAKTLLGWQAQYSITDMAQTAWNWYTKHPNGF